MRSVTWSSLLALLVAVAGCGGTVVFSEDGGAGDGGAGGGGADDTVTTTTSGAGGASTTGGGPVGTAVSATSSGGSVVTATASGGTGGGDVTSIIPIAAEMKLFADCMPEVEPDPVRGSVLVTYENQSDSFSGSLDLNQVDLVFANDVEGWVFPAAFQPISSGLVEAGATVITEHVKVDGGVDIASICQLCSQEGVAAMRWDSGATFETPFFLECAL